MWLQNPGIWLDISTYCNAACPQCHRTNSNGLDKVDWLPLLQWDLETFKKVFPVPARYPRYEFCGTWGDPIMNKDILEIVKYISDNSNSKIIIDTNGSLRDESFWWDLGVAGGENLVVYFAVDGSTQEIHEKYRRKTDLSKIISNMNELSLTQAKVRVVTIVFKHNENDIKNITDLVFSNGATIHKWYPSDRFKSRSDKFDFLNDDGQHETFERASASNEGKVFK